MARKQEHLEAGKRRLEEFRRKKAAEKEKKVLSTSQFHDATTICLSNQLPVHSEDVQVMNSDEVWGSVVEPPSDIATKLAQNSELGFSMDAQMKTSLVANDQKYLSHDISSTDIPVGVNYNEHAKARTDGFGIHIESQRRLAHEATSNQFALRPETIWNIDGGPGQHNSYGTGEECSMENGTLNDSSIPDTATSHLSVVNTSLEESSRILPPKKYSYVGAPSGDNTALLYKDSIESSTKVIGPSTWEQSLGSSVANLPNVHNVSFETLESLSTNFDLDSRNDLYRELPYLPMADNNTRRSRPSFLDSLNIPRPSASLIPLTEPTKPLLSRFNNYEISNMNVKSSFSQNPFPETLEPLSELTNPNESLFEHSMNSSDPNISRVDQLELGIKEYDMRMKHDLRSKKQDEDFSALEQHIEDLTQEKFSLQRAVEASRALAESLAAENSDLTDGYNQQGSVVNELRSDMEKLRDEIKAQLVEHESIKVGYVNAELECNACDERAKLLASEIIVLKEKALKLRSSELKLGRQLEKSEAEFASYKKKMVSLERDRQDLQSAVVALQEEKSLLQTKLRNASRSGKAVDGSRSPSKKKDMSTSTEDICHENTVMSTSNLDLHSSMSLSRLSMQFENRLSSFKVSSANIPSDHMRVIQNISALISELALEKEELMQVLVDKSSCSFELMEFNKELTKKLEAQTQQLEILTAQSMASQNVPVTQQDSQTMQENTAYADEGDEVVERVLGWIMKLFPGGAPKRRTSKLL